VLKEEEHNIIEEYAQIDDEAIYDVPPVNYDNDIDANNNCVSSCNVGDEIDDVGDVCCSITKTIPAGKPKRERKLVFSNREMEIIKSNKMLTDESINIAQKILKKSFPKFGGLFDTVLAKVNSTDVIPSTTPYIQILNVQNCHWICTSSTATDKKNNQLHYIYDSLVGSVSNEVKHVIAGYSMCPESSLRLIIKPVQQQNNGVDCGVFAIAFATALAHGVDPCTIAFDTNKMRDHLIKCLKLGTITMFPKIEKRVRRCSSRKVVVPLYCHCRLPYVEGNEMVLCGDCNEWYHYKCEKIKRSHKLKNIDWKCSTCK